MKYLFVTFILINLVFSKNIFMTDIKWKTPKNELLNFLKVNGYKVVKVDNDFIFKKTINYYDYEVYLDFDKENKLMQFHYALTFKDEDASTIKACIDAIHVNLVGRYGKPTFGTSLWINVNKNTIIEFKIYSKNENIFMLTISFMDISYFGFKTIGNLYKFY